MSDFVRTVDTIGDEALTNSIIDRSIAEIADDISTSIGDYAFLSCSKLTTASFKKVTSVGKGAFEYCFKLITADFPVATNIKPDAFSKCEELTTVNFPAVTSIGSNAFAYCYKLTAVDFPSVTKIATYAFTSCSALTALILRSEAITDLWDAKAFGSTPIASGTGYIYVPSSLVDSYKADAVWSTYAAQFRALEDYTVDGTTTGALDESKV